jgi:signal transduction histidine kinase
MDIDAAGLQLDLNLASAQIVGDRVLLERVTNNLVSNAIIHNQPAIDGPGWIRVAVGAVDGEAQLTVANSGPLISAADAKLVFEPFRRLNGNQLGNPRGTGLGLTIARAATITHGGTIEAKPLAEGGLEVTVRVPAVT